MGSARFLLMLAVVPALIAASDAIPVKPANEPAVSNEISTDRPDFTESTDTMAFGTFQLESGLLFSGHGPSRQVGGPFPLLRIGLTRFAELRLGTDGLALQSDMEEGRTRRQAGGSDAEVAVKVRLWEERKYVPALAAIAGFSFPVGSRYFTSGGTDPVLDFCWSKSLPRGFDAGGNINFRRETAEGETEARHTGEGRSAPGDESGGPCGEDAGVACVSGEGED